MIFLYEDLQWGDGEAVAGVNAGDGINFITVPGSLSQDISSISETSNVGDPGMWIFSGNKFATKHIIDCNPTTLQYSIICSMYATAHLSLSVLFILYTVPGKPPSTAPENFRASFKMPTSIKFTWSALEDDGIVRWYIITCQEADYTFVVRRYDMLYTCSDTSLINSQN